MGKKAKKKSSRRPAKKAGDATKASGGMFKVGTGGGATPAELGQKLVDAFNRGKGDELIATLWSPKIESIEGVGVGLGWRGVKAVRAKNDEWSATHVVHGASAEGPYVGSTGFAMKMRIDVEDKTTGNRRTLEEIRVYTVKGGKIVREEFMYAMG